MGEKIDLNITENDDIDITSLVKDKALAVGFDLVGVCSAEPVGELHVERLKDWLDLDFAGEMGYMHRNFDKRVDPGALLEGAKSVICVALNYTPAELPDDMDDAGDIGIAKIAKFALYEDYHDFMKDKLREVAEFLVATGEFPNVRRNSSADPQRRSVFPLTTGTYL